MAEVLEPENPGMHTTDTVDFDVVMSGEVYLELDDGSEVLLKAGDCVVQNGTPTPGATGRRRTASSPLH
jgi:uncharacterized cupin superfamily protein